VATELAQAIQFFLVTLSSIFFLVDPFALVPTFLAMTASSSQSHRGRWRGAPRLPASSC
jgi:multiple antibiotic resistance protein